MCGKMNNGDMLILFLITLFGAIICTYCIRRILLNARIADNPIVSEHIKAALQQWVVLHFYL